MKALAIDLGGDARERARSSRTVRFLFSKRLDLDSAQGLGVGVAAVYCDVPRVAEQRPDLTTKDCAGSGHQHLRLGGFGARANSFQSQKMG